MLEQGNPCFKPITVSVDKPGFISSCPYYNTILSKIPSRKAPSLRWTRPRDQPSPPSSTPPTAPTSPREQATTGRTHGHSSVPYGAPSEPQGHHISTRDFPPLLSQVGNSRSSSIVKFGRKPRNWLLSQDLLRSLFDFSRLSHSRRTVSGPISAGTSWQGIRELRETLFPYPNFYALNRPRHSYLKNRARKNRKHYG